MLDVLSARLQTRVWPPGIRAQELPGPCLRLSLEAPANLDHRLVVGSGCLTLTLTSSRPSPRPQKTLVTESYREAPLVDVLQAMAHSMGKRLILGPGVEGTVDLDLHGVPPEAALALALRMMEYDLDYKILTQGQLLVAIPEGRLWDVPDPDARLAVPPDSMRQEFLLVKASAERMIQFLTGQYPRVRFALHPTMNGFYATGSKHDLLLIRSQVPCLDRGLGP